MFRLGATEFRTKLTWDHCLCSVRADFQGVAHLIRSGVFGQELSENWTIGINECCAFGFDGSWKDGADFLEGSFDGGFGSVALKHGVQIRNDVFAQRTLSRFDCRAFNFRDYISGKWQWQLRLGMILTWQHCLRSVVADFEGVANLIWSGVLGKELSENGSVGVDECRAFGFDGSG